MKYIKNITYSFILLFFKVRHVGFEIYNRSVFVKNIKKNIKLFIPGFVFNFFHNRKIKRLLEFPESFSIETVNLCNARCWFCPQPEHNFTCIRAIS